MHIDIETRNKIEQIKSQVGYFVPLTAEREALKTSIYELVGLMMAAANQQIQNAAQEHGQLSR